MISLIIKDGLGKSAFSICLLQGICNIYMRKKE